MALQPFGQWLFSRRLKKDFRRLLPHSYFSQRQKRLSKKASLNALAARLPKDDFRSLLIIPATARRELLKEASVLSRDAAQSTGLPQLARLQPGILRQRVSDRVEHVKEVTWAAYLAHCGNSRQKFQLLIADAVLLAKPAVVPEFVPGRFAVFAGG